jgi:hypothetical protein
MMTTLQTAHDKRAQGDIEGAIQAYRLAAEAEPTPQNLTYLGATLLIAGNLNEGFRLLQARRKFATNLAPALPFTRWTGEEVKGRRLLIWSEEGFGDQIMFARFAKIVRERGAEVDWLCPTELVRLISTLGVRALPSDQSHDLAGYDYYAPTGWLPVGFDMTLETLPNRPYFEVLSTNNSGIGIMTRGNPSHENDAHRSLPDHVAAELFALPGARDLSPAATGAIDFYDTATIIAGLTEVVSVDTAVAHLAGAMGKRVHVLLPAINTDWRWMTDRKDSPWYPSAILYRQRTADNWAPVLEDLKDALASGRRG